MARMVKKNGRFGSSPGRFPRVARVNEVIREVVANELERLVDDDPRLELVTVTGVDADPDVKRATVFFSSLATKASTDDVIEALNEHRVGMQSAIARGSSFKNTPQLTFKPDLGIVEGQKVEAILRSIRDDSSDDNE